MSLLFSFYWIVIGTFGMFPELNMELTYREDFEIAYIDNCDVLGLNQCDFCDTELTLSQFGDAMHCLDSIANPKKEEQLASSLSAKGIEDDLVSFGYFKMRKSQIAGSVASIKLNNQVINGFWTLDQFLVGRAAGLNVRSCFGQLNCNASYSIRGSQGSPLFVLDGLPLMNFDPRMLNINDIEEITILKDAASTSIYGIRGGSGVIVISTKRG